MKKKNNLWVQRQNRDSFYKLSRKEGYRSRAAYKIIEINDRYKLISKGINVIDLGASPGGWSQVLSIKLATLRSKIFAIDEKNIEPIKNVKFFKKNIEEIDDSFLKLNSLNNISLILSDIAPNATGHKFTDQARAHRLCLKVLEFVKKTLSNKGNFVCKYLRGNEENEFISELKKYFLEVEIFKPKASRNISKEIYLICLSFNNLQ